MSEEIVIGLIAFFGVVIGSVMSIAGHLLVNWLEHKKRINFLLFETFFKQKLVYLERLGQELERIVERHNKFYVWINNAGKPFQIENVISRKLTISEVKNLIEKTLVQISKEALEDYKPHGKALYLPKNSPLYQSLAVFIENYAHTLILVRALLDKNLRDIELTKKVNIRLLKDIEQSSIVLADIRKEALTAISFRKV